MKQSVTVVAAVAVVAVIVVVVKMSNNVTTNSSDDEDDDEKTFRTSPDTRSLQSSPSQSFYASFKIYINRLSGRFNEEATRVSAPSGDEEGGSSQNENETRVVVRIEELGNRKHSDESSDSGEDDDDVFEQSPSPVSSVTEEPESQTFRPEVTRISPPKPIASSLTRENREESPVFYLDPADWVRVEGSSPVPVTLPVVAQDPITIPEVTISPTRRKSSMLASVSENNVVACDQINSKLLLSPPHVSGGCCGCMCSNINVGNVVLDEQTKRRLRSKSYSSGHNFTAMT